MCLIVFAYGVHPAYRLMLAGNRDEFYERPSAPLDFWADAPGVLGGRDLKGGGTWMGVDIRGRWAAVTNYRDPARIKPDAASRGHLIRDYLQGSRGAESYSKALRLRQGRYNGYNLLLGDRQAVYYSSNCGVPATRLSPGIYGLSNHLLDTPWPKIKTAKRLLGPWFEGRNDMNLDAVFNLLKDDHPAPDHLLPDTGIGPAWERLLSPVFIRSSHYGTRSSTILRISRAGQVEVAERTYDPSGETLVESDLRRFTFPIEEKIREMRRPSSPS
jgi:uncharacterized protein with NRDE domain